MELNQTVMLMISSDYKERFLAEYWQAKIRYDRLHQMIVKAEAGTPDFTPDCPLELLKKQKAAMGNYLYCLEVRAQIEQIALDEPRGPKKRRRSNLGGNTFGNYIRLDGQEITAQNIAKAEEALWQEAEKLIRQTGLPADTINQVEMINKRFNEDENKVMTIGWKVTV